MSVSLKERERCNSRPRGEGAYSHRGLALQEASLAKDFLSSSGLAKAKAEEGLQRLVVGDGRTKGLVDRACKWFGGPECVYF